MSSSSMQSPDATAIDQHGYPRPLVAWTTVALLLAIYILSFIDRQIISLMERPLKEAFGLNDTQFGALGGLAFGLFYAAFGLICARIADYGSRTKLVAVGVFLWSLATAASGFARSFTHLVICRIGVGVGEATLGPGANSLIADSFPKERLATAVSVYAMGIPIGSAMAFILGGKVISLVDQMAPVGIAAYDQLAAWQKVFVLVGLPGLLMSGLMLLVREPARKGEIATKPAKKEPITAVFKSMGTARKAYMGMILGLSVNAAIGFGSLFWLAPFFARAHGLSPAEIGLTFGLMGLLTGPMGLLLGGYLADRWTRLGRHDAHILAVMVAPLGYTLPSIAQPLVPSVEWAWGMTFIASMFTSLPTGAAFSGLNLLTPNRLRGQVIAVTILSTTIFGYGIGIPIVGLLSEIIGTHMGDPSWGLRYAMVILAVVSGPLCIGFYIWARKAWATAMAARTEKTNEA